MKKIGHLLLCFVLTFLIFGAAHVFAATAGSLENFAKTKSFSPDTFTDVKSNHWFYPGVMTAYEKGIMEGVTDNSFNPNGNVTQAQAVAIAARVHAIYYGNTIKDVDSPDWFAKYFEYAKGWSLLPPDTADVSMLDSTLASRSFIAYLFKNVISESDLPAINSKEIPDLNKIPAGYQDAVKAMYSSGIITGKEGGNFDGAGFATRGEISTIITRLVDKMERVAYDSKYNASMDGQEGNCQSDGNMVYDSQNCYYIFENSKGEYSIVRRNSQTRSVDTLYSCIYGPIYNLQLYDNCLYFIQSYYDVWGYYAYSTLYRLDLNTLESNDVYDGDFLGCYTIYGGNIYLESLSFPNDQTITNKILEITPQNTVTTVCSFNEITYNINAFNEKLYLENENSLYEVSLATKSAKQILKPVAGSIMVKNIIYYGDKDGNFFEADLSAPEDSRLLFSVNSETYGNIINLSYINNKLYFTCDKKKAIFEVTKGGAITQAAATLEYPLSFSIWGELFFYSYDKDKPENIIVGGKNIKENNNTTLASWFENGFDSPKSYPLLDCFMDIISSAKESTGEPMTILSSKKIYEKCSPAVFLLESFDENQEPTGFGSGFFITSNGIAVTNYHVIQDAAFLVACLPNGEYYEVQKVLAYDEEQDIAILKIAEEGLPYIPVGDSSSVTGGEKVYAIGNPEGLTNTLSEGIVSNPSRKFSENVALIQISVPLSPGSSGGPLINEYGEAIGITSGGIVSESGQTFSFAVPIDEIIMLSRDIEN